MHTLRDDPDFVPELDYVMELNGVLIGHVMFVRAEIESDDGRAVPVMTLGPISIHPDYQRKGFGKILLNYVLDKAAEMGVGAVCIKGTLLFTENLDLQWRARAEFIIMQSRGARQFLTFLFVS